jgi:hypothetical protein
MQTLAIGSKLLFYNCLLYALAYAVALRTTFFFASGRAEETIYFRCFGGFAAKTTEKDNHFHAAAGERRPLRREQACDRLFRLRQGENTVLFRLLLRLRRKSKRKR